MKKCVITFILTLIVTLAAFFITPCFFGYHLVYIQKYSFDLDSMDKVCSIIFGFLGTLGTVSAVWVAIRIPKKIAEQQNKIALFEKRWFWYQTIQNVAYFMRDLSIYKDEIQNLDTDVLKKLLVKYNVDLQKIKYCDEIRYLYNDNLFLDIFAEFKDVIIISDIVADISNDYIKKRHKDLKKALQLAEKVNENLNSIFILQLAQFLNLKGD